MNKVIIGIDIAKDTLEIAVLEQQNGHLLQQLTLPNTEKGHVRLITLAQRYREVHLVMEATGTYHLRLVKALFEAGLKQSVINPLQLKRFAQMKLRRVKTDRSDAHLLAQYGREQKPSAHKMQPIVQQQLKQINTHLEQLVKQRTALKNMLHANSQLPESVSLCDKVLKQMIKQLDASLVQLLTHQETLIESCYASERILIESVKGVGPRTALAVLAYLGDLSGFETHKQVVAYMGLNPVPQESGTSLHAPMHISKQGNGSLRRLFYLCALSAKRHNTVCRALYERLRAKGKAEKVALIAVANKLVKQVFVVVKTGEMFDNDYLEKNRPRGLTL